MKQYDVKDTTENVDEQIKRHFNNQNVEGFRDLFLEALPYDQAQFFHTLTDEERLQLYSYLSPTEMAVIFEHITEDDFDYNVYLSEMNPSYAADMLTEMYADDAVDVLNELDQEQVTNYLTIMDDDVAQEFRELLDYQEYTAGSIMTTEFISIFENQTVRSAMNILKKEAEHAETIYYIYVIDEEKKLLGVISLRELIVADDDTMISSIMTDRVISVAVSDDQENIARMMRDYDFLAVPVINLQDQLVGIITVDDIIDVVDEEATDDYSKLAGVSNLDTYDKGPYSAAKKRLPWLIILLFLGLLTANIIGRFEETLDKVAILAVFIPLIAGMAGNTGTQALAVAVRSISTGDIEDESKLKLLAREAGTGVIIGLICGILVTGIVFLWQQNLYLGILVGSSISCTLFVATIAGSFVPLLMHRLKIDPAVASGPFITTINDLISIFIYFGLATLFMGYLQQ